MEHQTAPARQTWVLIWALLIIALIVTCALVYNEWFRSIGMKYVRVYFGKVQNMTPYILSAVLSTIGVMLVELWAVGWKQSSLASLIRPGRTVFNDIFLWILEMSQIGFIMIYILTFGLFRKLHRDIREILGFDSELINSIASPLIQIILFALLIDFLSYVLHYLVHHIPQLWVFHKVHHSSSEFTVMSASRVHPVERHFLVTLFLLLPLAVVGVPVEYAVIFSMLRFFCSALNHSKLNWDWGWIGKYIIASPQYHRLHHSQHEKHYDKNLAEMFPVWDHLFGTYCPDRIEANEVGLVGNPYNRNHVVHDFFISFREFYGSLRK